MGTVTLIPWERDFLAGLKEILLLERGAGGTDSLAQTTVVFPHRRPARYLLDIFRNDDSLPRPLLLPELTSIPDFVNQLRLNLSDVPFSHASVLDQVGLLYECVSRLKLEGAGSLTNLPLDPQRFFPWGVRLARLFDDMLRQNIEPADILHMEGEVVDYAAALLEQLGTIYARFTESLLARGWTTPGYAAYWAPQWLEGIVEGLAGRTVYFAGFYALTGTEEKLIRTLWQRCGARVVLHGDPALCPASDGQRTAPHSSDGQRTAPHSSDGQRTAPHWSDRQRTAPHWSCAEHARLLRRWNARVELHEPQPTSQPAPPATNVRFIEGFDLHSQLDALSKELAEHPLEDAAGQARAAVVLPDTSMLLPVLHHLPDSDVNVSMGYPLSRTTLHRLLEIFLRLQETRHGEAATRTTYYWRELIDLIRHPYLKMLEIEGEQPLRSAFRTLEHRVRTGDKFMDPRSWLANEVADEDLAREDSALSAMSPVSVDTVRELLGEVFATCLSGFEGLRTLADLADALDRVCDLLLRFGANLWKRFAIDAECLHRLLHETIPTLRHCTLADQEFSREVLFSVLRDFLDTERVPFEAEPLAGLQVLGMLETRLLRFGRVYVVNAVDDQLPGTPAHDPLLPDSLRSLLGLPDSRMRDLVSAFNFHRLIRGADEAVILYQSGTGGEGPNARAVRSRFVEELLWEREQEAGELFKPGQGPLKMISYPITPIPRVREGAAKGPEVAALLDAYLARAPLSASALDQFLTCPGRFFLERLCRLRPVAEVDEDGDPASLGNAVHEALRKFFQPHADSGAPINRADLNPEELADAFERTVSADGFFRQLPFDQRTVLIKAGRERMHRYLAAMGESTTVLHLEQHLAVDMVTPSRTFQLHGYIDRVDRRDGLDTVLDYKTGSLHAPGKKFWDDAELWSMMAARPRGRDLDNVLELLAEGVKSVQLPLYLHLYAASRSTPPHDAALIDLKDSCKEKPLLGGMKDEERRTVITERIPALLGFLCESLVRCDAFHPRQGRHCDWCPYRSSC